MKHKKPKKRSVSKKKLEKLRLSAQVLHEAISKDDGESVHLTNAYFSAWGKQLPPKLAIKMIDRLLELERADSLRVETVELGIGDTAQSVA